MSAIRISRTDGSVEEVSAASVATTTDPASIAVEPPERRLVPLAAVMLRLELVGRKADLITIINAPGNEHAREQLMGAVDEGIYADDLLARSLIAMAGADPDAILA